MTTGAQNIILGKGAAGSGALTGDDNIFLGTSAGKSVTSGEANVHIGVEADVVLHHLTIEMFL